MLQQQQDDFEAENNGKFGDPPFRRKRQTVRNKLSAQISRLKDAYERSFFCSVIQAKDDKYMEFFELFAEKLKSAGQQDLLDELAKDQIETLDPVDSYCQREFTTKLIPDENSGPQREIRQYHGKNIGAKEFARYSAQLFHTCEGVKNRFENEQDSSDEDDQQTRKQLQPTQMSHSSLKS